VTPRLDGLEINPCIPTSWKGFKVHRKFRGKVYKIEVKNPTGASKGVKRMMVDGSRVTRFRYTSAEILSAY
jgi:cellobiose phosphorylase